MKTCGDQSLVQRGTLSPRSDQKRKKQTNKLTKNGLNIKTKSLVLKCTQYTWVSSDSRLSDAANESSLLNTTHRHRGCWCRHIEKAGQKTTACLSASLIPVWACVGFLWAISRKMWSAACEHVRLDTLFVLAKAPLSIWFCSLLCTHPHAVILSFSHPPGLCSLPSHSSLKTPEVVVWGKWSGCE